ncbi:Gfo/Idh/MocA family oxidoreductase, partial [Pelagibacterales bacterium SAG-MED46]|nr:Gfo/Idh/MocA family oxidoreductase [Pelagibacterales bacterium SAG-MED46]
MKILILGNSNIFNRKIFPALLKFRKINIELASRGKIYNEHNISKIYKNYSEALKNTKAKIVYISLINSKHYYWALKALNKNKHVILDKPLTLHYKDSLKLLICAKKRKLIIAESTVFHFHKQFNKIQSLMNLKKKISIKTFFHIPKLN